MSWDGPQDTHKSVRGVGNQPPRAGHRQRLRQFIPFPYPTLPTHPHPSHAYPIHPWTYPSADAHTRRPRDRPPSSDGPTHPPTHPYPAQPTHPYRWDGWNPGQVPIQLFRSATGPGRSKQSKEESK